MEHNSKKNILIVGGSAKDWALIQKLKSYDFIGQIFITTVDKTFDRIANTVDIRPDNAKELLEFALENNISMTIVTDQKSLKSDIETYFVSNGQQIFAPSRASAEIIFDKGLCKKLLYKMRIKTPKFAVFDKENLAIDYLNGINFPIIISACSSSDRYAVSTVAGARVFIKDLFFRGVEKIVIEEYIYGEEFSYYFLTDGYKILPLVNCSNRKFLQDNIGGIITDGIGGFAPNYKLNLECVAKVEDIAERIIIHQEAEGIPYMGIFGINGVLGNDGEIYTLQVANFFKDTDANMVLNLVEDNIYRLFESCINGNFSDDYEEISILDGNCVSCELIAKYDDKLIKGLDLYDSNEVSASGLIFDKEGNIFTKKSQKLIMTKKASTLSRAALALYEDIDCINYDGKEYKTDILSGLKAH